LSGTGVLLLGGGFIGCALSERLAAEGRPVHVLTRSPLTGASAAGAVHVGDLSEPALLREVGRKCDTVVYLASTTTPGTSAVYPSKEIDNLVPMLRLLDFLKEWPDKHLIFLSSGGTVYGNPERNPVPETAALAPLSYHGAGKVALEAFLHAFRAAGHAVTVLRPSNAYGPGQNLRHGFGLVRTVLQHIVDGTTLNIWGDGENVRDFVYVQDVVDAIVAAVDASGNSGTYNVGSGTGHTLKQVVDIAERVCGAAIRLDYHPARPADVREVVLDISHIGAELGWRPGVALEEGVRRTWPWLRAA
jgi:UDP-glucose 4-epimerase